MNKSAIFRVMFPDVSGLALHEWPWKTMFVEISAMSVYAMDLKLKSKKYSARAGPKRNGSRNLGRADDWCRV